MLLVRTLLVRMLTVLALLVRALTLPAGGWGGGAERVLAEFDALGAGSGR